MVAGDLLRGSYPLRPAINGTSHKWIYPGSCDRYNSPAVPSNCPNKPTALAPLCPPALTCDLLVEQGEVDRQVPPPEEGGEGCAGAQPVEGGAALALGLQLAQEGHGGEVVGVEGCRHPRGEDGCEGMEGGAGGRGGEGYRMVELARHFALFYFTLAHCLRGRRTCHYH